MLREGGNAVDAAVCAVLASFAVESPLTGFGAGGFMMVHEDGAEPALIDFFVAAPGRDGIERRAELVPVPVHFDAETTQTFYVGPASCGVPGTAAGLEQALGASARCRSPTWSGRRCGSPARARRSTPSRPTSSTSSPRSTPGSRAPGSSTRPGAAAARGRRVPLPGAGRGARTLRRRRGRAVLPRRGRGGDRRVRARAAAAPSGPADLAAYEAIPRAPIRVPFRGTEVLTNPPPSSGGILIAYSLGC